MLSAENRSSSDIKKFKHRHFERHTLKRKWDLFPLAWTLPNLFVFTLTETICLKIWAKPLSKCTKKATSVDVHRPGTSWLKLVDMSYSFQSMCHLLNHLTHYLLVSFVVVYRRIQNTLSRTRLLNPPTLRHLHKFLVHHYQLRMWMAEIAVNIFYKTA